MSTIINDIISHNSKLEKLRDLLLIFWGNTGYLNYEIIKQNKSSDAKKLVDELHYLCSLDFINDFDEISESCDSISEYISITDLNHVFNEFNNNKLIDISKDFTHISKSINTNKLSTNRWMSFMKHQDINEKSEGFGNILINIPINKNTQNLKFIETNGLCDLNEIIVNSNELLKLNPKYIIYEKLNK